MPKKNVLQFKRNVDLSSKLMDYITMRPKILDSLPTDAYMVIIPSGNGELVKSNKELAKTLVKSGKKVVKAINSPTGSSWRFSF